MNFEFKAVTFLKLPPTIGDFVNFAMRINHFLINPYPAKLENMVSS